MRVRFGEDELGVLTVRLGMPFGTGLFASAIALLFFLVGLVFLLASLPHSEILRCERRGSAIACTRAQALAGQWELFSRSQSFSGAVRAAVERRRDDGGDIYQTFVEWDGGRFYFGKTKHRREDAVAAIAPVNTFLGDPRQTQVEVREDVWWWFAVPFGILAVAISFLLMAYVTYRNRWIFDRRRHEVRRQQFPWSRATDRWLLHDVAGVAVAEHIDFDGDTFHNLRLVLRAGDPLDMSNVSPAGKAPRRLLEASDRINRFLGVTPLPPTRS